MNCLPACIVNASFRYLTLRVLRDDGVVVYLNGAEISRDNLPPGAISSGTLALRTIGGVDETTWLTAAIDPTLLMAGTNLMAAAIHQSGTNSSDISFDLELIGYSAASLPRLGGAVQAGALAVSWPGWAAGYQLLCATNLHQPVVWSAVTDSPFLSNHLWHVTLAGLTNGPRFYRLQAP